MWDALYVLYGRPNEMELTHQEDDRWREYAEHGGKNGAEVHPGVLAHQEFN